MTADVFSLRTDVESLSRKETDKLAELERRSKLTDSYYRELKAGVENLTERLTRHLEAKARGLLVPLSLLRSHSTVMARR